MDTKDFNILLNQET